MRFEISGGMSQFGHGIVMRLPLRLGISFWPAYWSLMFGVELSGGCWEWHLGPFAGEVWRDREE